MLKADKSSLFLDCWVSVVQIHCRQDLVPCAAMPAVAPKLLDPSRRKADTPAAAGARMAPAEGAAAAPKGVPCLHGLNDARPDRIHALQTRSKRLLQLAHSGFDIVVGARRTFLRIIDIIIIITIIIDNLIDNRSDGHGFRSKAAA